MQHIDVSVIIVSWNTKELLKRCLESIFAKTKSTTIEVIVVDNDSADGSANMVAECFPQVILVSNENNGFARANNLAIASAKGRDILFLNPDTELITNAIDGLHAYLDHNRGRIIAASCMLLNTDSSIQYTCARRFPTPWNELCFFIFLDRVLGFLPIFSGAEMRHWNHQTSRIVPCLSGACIMADGKAVSDIGGFADSYFMYGEDLELCWRLSRKHGKLAYIASEKIYHHSGASSIQKRWHSNTHFKQRVANAEFWRRNRSAFYSNIYKFAVGTGAFLRFLILYALIFSRKLLFMNTSDRQLLLCSRCKILIAWAFFPKQILAPSDYC
jgi:GT2 family glycosyltransferase